MSVTFILLSGYQDSNLGPPAPKAGALAGLRYTPKLCVGVGVVRVVSLNNYHTQLWR